MVKIIYGIKKPAWESTAELEEFQKKIFNSHTDFLIYSMEAWHNTGLKNVPEIFIFDRYGAMIPYSDTTTFACSGSVTDFLMNLKVDVNSSKKPAADLNKFCDSLYVKNCYAKFSPEIDDTDYYIFISWAKWTGRLIYKQKVMPWMKAIETNENATIKTYFINTDLQQCWDKDFSHKDLK